MHFFVYEIESGSFHSGPKLPKHAVAHGRFGSRAQAQEHAKKLKRDFLSPVFDIDGHLLAPRERAVLGVWYPQLYEQALKRGRVRAHHVQPADAVEVRA
jgi:hypothetical protein